MEYVKCTLHNVEYKNTSTMGNPSYYIAFSDDKNNYYRGFTSCNASAGYTASNYNYAENGNPIYLQYHFTKSGSCIIDRIKHNTPEQAKQEATK